MKALLKDFKYYIVIFALIACATMPLFKSSLGNRFMIVCLFLIITSLRLNLQSILFLFVLTGLEIFHNIYFNNYDSGASIYALYSFTICILVVNFAKLKFIEVYINILCVFAIISFPFFILAQVSPQGAARLAGMVPSFLTVSKEIYGEPLVQANPVIYNFDFNWFEMGRNNGPFWEPTVFATMLTLAQIFNLLKNKTIFNKIGWIFSIAVCTTLSTTGALAYFILVFSYFIYLNRSRVMANIVISSLVLASGVFTYLNVPYLSNKINKEFGNVQEDIGRFHGSSRAASATLDIQEVRKDDIYLVLGKGSSKNTRIGTVDKTVLRNCGITSLLVEYGIPFFLLYFGLVYYSFYRLCKIYMLPTPFAIAFASIFFLSGYSEVFFDLPFFHCFLFFGFMIDSYYKNNVAIVTKTTRIKLSEV